MTEKRIGVYALGKNVNMSGGGRQRICQGIWKRTTQVLPWNPTKTITKKRMYHRYHTGIWSSLNINEKRKGHEGRFWGSG